MAINFNFTAPNGWNKFAHANNAIDNLQLLDCEFPYLYVPAGGFWARSWLGNCLIPWQVGEDPFNSFLLGGGSSGTLVGAVSGLSNANTAIALASQHQAFGIGQKAPGPRAGFCLGNKFKQHIYLRFDVFNDGMGLGIIVPNKSIELVQNSRFKRSFVNHGSVVRYTNTNGHILTLDITKSTPPSASINAQVSVISNKITITNTSGVSTTVDVMSLKNNWDVVISPPTINIEPNSFYSIDKTWYIEDPYLMSGFWTGTESSTTKPNSGMDLYVTSHNSPYEEGYILGIYIWEEDTAITTTTTTASSSSTTSTTTTTSSSTSTTTTLIPSQPDIGTSMMDNGGYTWAFYGLGNTTSTSAPYYPPNNDRYRAIHLDAPDASGNMTEYTTRIKTTYAQYTALINKKPSYIRVEIATGGFTSRHNWYAPCLKNSYIKSNGKLYRILDHVGFNIIDVSFVSVDGKTTFDPAVNQKYSIMNQYAWFITEDYDGRLDHSGSNTTGIFKGNVKSLGDPVSPATTGSNKITIQTLGDTNVSRYKSKGLSFVDRYQKDVQFSSNPSSSPSSTFKKLFDKFSGWKLVLNNGVELGIKSVDFSNAISATTTPYPIVVELIESTTIPIGMPVYITFDTSFNVFGSFSKEASFNLNLDVTYANGMLCLNGEYDTVPYKLDISDTDLIGFTEGYLFGVGFAVGNSKFSQTLLFTTPAKSRGVASFFHDLRQEDWVAYTDAVTGKMVIRKGSFDFTEYPMKETITLGKSKRSVTLSSNPTTEINFIADYAILRRMGFKFVSDNSSDLGILFATGTKDNVFGFYISGDGVANLQLYNKEGKAVGSVPSDFYKGEGHAVSPVYVYKPAYYQNLPALSVDLGIPISKQKIYFLNGKVSDVWLEFIDDNQTIESKGYYDIIRLSSGENLFIYAYQTGSFRIGDKTNNSKDNSTIWDNSNAVMIAGTYDDGWTWASPVTHRVDDIDNIRQYPLMIMNSVDYLGCIYNQVNETLCIFVRCSHKTSGPTVSYLGCYIVPIYNLPFNNLLCTVISPSKSAPFLWKPPMFYDNFINNDTKFWTDSKNIIEDGFELVAQTATEDTKVTNNSGATIANTVSSALSDFSNIKNEYFVRIMGPNGSGAQFHNGDEFGIISANIMPDGTYIIFYDSIAGIRAIFSKDGGGYWFSSYITFAKNAKNAILVGNSLFYIAPEGIKMKDTQITDFYNARNIGKMNEGIDKTNAEIALQSTLDAERQVLIGSGVIESQRISGYTTPQGIIKIFFYDLNNLLKCIESKDSYKWNVANNF
jgi:hypothetical protein